ncbi:MAG: hypothetical protein R3F49_02460 [Planctomycetota bacterium]
MGIFAAPSRARNALLVALVVSALGPRAAGDAPEVTALRVQDPSTQSAPAPSTRDRGSLPQRPWSSPAIEAAVRRGLDHLARQQLPATGAVALGADAAGERAHVAVTALAALAWMSGGSTTNRGPHQQEVTRALEYLLACTERAGDEHPGYVHDRQDSISRMHGQGLAALAFAEAYTLSPESSLGRRLSETLKLVVERIEVSQGAEGGWYYDPFRTAAHEGSVTVSLVQALRAARNAGILVNPGVIARAVQYLERSQLQERGADGALPRDFGGFRYSLVDAQTSVALTAAGLSTLHATGVYDGPVVRDGYDYIWRKLAAREVDLARGDTSAHPAFPYYERFYLAQALWQNPDPTTFARWASDEFPRIVAAQRADGAWDDVRNGAGGRVHGRYGTSYATATNCIVLSLPESQLPILAR